MNEHWLSLLQHIQTVRELSKTDNSQVARSLTPNCWQNGMQMDALKYNAGILSSAMLVSSATASPQKSVSGDQP